MEVLLWVKSMGFSSLKCRQLFGFEGLPISGAARKSPATITVSYMVPFGSYLVPWLQHTNVILLIFTVQRQILIKSDHVYILHDHIPCVKVSEWF